MIDSWNVETMSMPQYMVLARRQRAELAELDAEILRVAADRAEAALRESTDSYAMYREHIHALAVEDLQALGVEHPHLAWKRIVDVLHARETTIAWAREPRWDLIRLYAEALRIAEVRGDDAFCGPADVQEAELTLGLSEQNLRREIARRSRA